jgi:hypothetical protein
MLGVSRFLICYLSVMVAGGVFAPSAPAQTYDQFGVVQQERPSIFRHLFRRRSREVPMTPDIQRRLDKRQLELQIRRPALPQPETIRPQRKKRDAEQPGKRRDASRPTKRRDAALRQAEPDKPRVQRRIRPAEEPVKPAEPVEKAADAKKILVVGDFMAGQLAKGLIDAYSANAGIAVVDANRGDSGLVRADAFDWAKELPALVQQENPAAIVMMVGANDRQSITTEAGSQQIGSEGWRAAYAARLATLASALKTTGKPVLWMGLPPVRSGQMSRDYGALNDIASEQLQREGIRFVDTWNGFADDLGKYTPVGPDIAGQQVQLRSKDGLNFTKSGQRKLAFFLEGDITSIIGGKNSGAIPQIAGLDALAGPPPELVRQGPAVPTIGPMVPIDALTSGGDELSGGAPGPAGSGAASNAVLDRLAAQASLAPTGRADNFAQPGAGPAPAVPAASPAVAPNPAGSPLAPPPSASVPGEPAAVPAR